MLLSFTVANHRSIRDEQVLGLTSGNDVLAATALYGDSATGKSNVLDALSFAAWMVQNSQTSPIVGVPRTPFAWDAARTQPTLFELEFRVDDVCFQYGFVVDDQHVLEEWLSAGPPYRKQLWFSRDASTFTFGEHLSGENEVIRKFTRANSLFLSVAAQNNHAQLQPLFRWFRSFRFTTKSDDRFSRVQRTFGEWWSRAASPSTNRFMQLLAAADVGVVAVRSTADSDGGFRIETKHRNHEWLSLDEASAGTVRLFELGPGIADALSEGGVVIVDGLDASLHRTFVRRLLQFFTDHEQNAKVAQLVFSTHDTSLLGDVAGEPALKREQIWFTEKNDEGATTLYPLTDFKARSVENLERAYLQSRYALFSKR